jgi:hypothetical protein
VPILSKEITDKIEITVKPKSFEDGKIRHFSGDTQPRNLNMFYIKFLPFLVF